MCWRRRAVLRGKACEGSQRNGKDGKGSERKGTQLQRVFGGDSSGWGGGEVFLTFRREGGSWPRAKEDTYLLEVIGSDF